MSLIITACSESFISLVDPTNLTVESYYKSTADLKGGLTGAYSSLQSIYNRWHIVGDVSSDNSYTNIITTGDPEYEMDRMAITITSPRVLSIWQNIYSSIAKANKVIEAANILGYDFDGPARTQIVAQAKFLRALNYFNLVRLWGNVPLITKTVLPDEAVKYTRETVDKIYTDLIIKDLVEIANILPAKYSGADVGRITSVAVKTLLGEVYMTRQNYSSAETILKEGLDAANTNGYKLLSKYSDVFLPDNANNTEIIFEVQYVRGLTPKEGNDITGWFAPYNSPASIYIVGRGNGYNQVHSDLYKSFESGDLRRDASLGRFIDATNKDTIYYTKKYIDPLLVSASDGGSDWAIYRYTDLQLLYAEALNENGKTSLAITEVNKIRTAPRTGLTALSTTLDQAAARLAIEKERRVELNMEGHRWFDLVRTGRVTTVMNAHFAKAPFCKEPAYSTLGVSISSPNQLLLPIPDSEIKTSNGVLTQNPGY